MGTPDVEPAIESTRKARDNAARAAAVAGELGFPHMSAELNDLAATYDRLLAELLRLQQELGE